MKFLKYNTARGPTSHNVVSYEQLLRSAQQSTSQTMNSALHDALEQREPTQALQTRKTGKVTQSLEEMPRRALCSFRTCARYEHSKTDALWTNLLSVIMH